MSDIKTNAWKRFDELMAETHERVRKLPVGNGHKYVIYSDWHLGDGDKGDRFRNNTGVVIESLKFYRENGFTVILNGDIDDYHRFDSNIIRDAYGENLFEELKKYEAAGKFFRIFGNHDIEWSLADPITGIGMSALEAIKLGDHVLITHGHQAEEWYEKDLQLVRVGTTLKRVKESLFGKLGGQFAFTQLPNKKDKIYADWAKKNKTVFIGGHTHNPVFESRPIYDFVDIILQKVASDIRTAKAADDHASVKALKKRRLWFKKRQDFTERKIDKLNIPRMLLDHENSLYFNSGAAIFLDGFTNIEIDGKIIRLFYWNNDSKTREQIWGDLDMSTEVPIT